MTRPDAAAEIREALEVDRAVDARRRVSTRVWPVPYDVGRALGWPTCRWCARPIEPGWQINWAGDAFHAQCVTDAVAAEHRRELLLHGAAA